MKLIVVVAAFALLVVPAGRTAPPPPQLVCTAIDAELLGNYFRYDDRSWELTFDAGCTYQARHHGTEEGGGDYTVSEHGIDAPLGVFVISNDRGCREPGLLDVPTAYTFAYGGGVLNLAPQTTDLCTNPKGEGRAQELAGHGGWIKAVAGRLTISTDSRFFKVKGVFADRGTFRVLHSNVRKGVKTAALRFSGVNGTFTVAERIRKGKAHWSLLGLGSGAYRNLSGGGSGVVHAAQVRQTLHGDVSN